MDLFEIAAGVLSATLGILGILTETRDRNTSQLTRWGKANLLLLCTTLAIGLLHGLTVNIANEASDYEQVARVRDATIMSNAQMRGISQAIHSGAAATDNIQRSILSIPSRLAASITIEVPCEALPRELASDVCVGDEARNGHISAKARSAFESVVAALHVSAIHKLNKTYADYAPRPDLLLYIDLGDASSYDLLYNEDDGTVLLQSIVPLETVVQRASPRVESFIDLIGMRVDVSFVGGLCDGRQAPATLEFPCSIEAIRLSTPTGRSFTLQDFAAPTDSRGQYRTEVTEDMIVTADDDY